MPQLWLILNTNGQRATGNGHWAMGNTQSEPKVDDPGNIDTTHHLSAKEIRKPKAKRG